MAGTGLDAETERIVKEKLLGLLESLEKKRISGHKLISDEDTVYTSLKNPRLGDIKVTVFPGKSLQVFLSNRRSPESPFSVMDASERRLYIERRPVEEVSDRDVLPALYLISHSDREMIHNPENKRVEFFSAFLNLVPDTGQPSGPPDITARPYEDLAPEERMELLRRVSSTDPIRERIMRDLFEFNVTFARYKQPEKLHTLRFPPGQVQEYVGQMSRDIYPQNLRYVLLRDYPADHDKFAAYLKDRLASLKNLVQGRRDLAVGEYAAYLDDVKNAADDQVAKINMMQGRKK